MLRHTTPYDFFDVDITFGLSSNQPFINDLHIVGRLWSTPILDKNGKLGEFGIYQHFNYYDSKPVITPGETKSGFLGGVENNSYLCTIN